MSDWNYVDEKVRKIDWINDGKPWIVDKENANIPLYTSFTYTDIPNSDLFQVYFQFPNEDPRETEAVYSILNGTVTHKMPGLQGIEILLVASMVVLEDDQVPPRRDKHFAGLTLAGDPQDAGVIGAQGGA